MFDYNQIEAIIWDMGGVLLRTEKSEPRISLAKQLNISRKELEAIVFDSDSSKLATVGKITTESHSAWLASQFSLSTGDMQKFWEGFWGGDHMDMILVNMIRQHKLQYKTGLLSNAWDDARREVGGKHAFLDAFHYSVFSAEAKLAKPDLAFYEHILLKLGVSAKGSIFIDDMQTNIDAARKAGMIGIRFESRDQIVEALKNL